MASVNKVILVGNLGRDPEVRYMPSGDPVATLSIATTDHWTDRNSGERQESTEWHRVVFFGKLAEICEQYLKKGGSVYVEGSIRTRKWTDGDGVERYSTEIRGDRMQMLGGRPNTSQGEGGDMPPPPRQRKPATAGGGNFDDDIPFQPYGHRMHGHII